MVSGDHPDVAQTIGAAVGADEVLAERSPAEKVDAVAAERAAGLTVIVGDGLDRVVEAVQVARRARAIALQSVLAGTGLSVAAMVAAAAGAISPLSGALLQEAIDVAVIFNALRALGDGQRARVAPKEAVGVADRFRQTEWPGAGVPIAG